jgi:dTDP-4-amino-4,6-dideoxygalactose transaminase
MGNSYRTIVEHYDACLTRFGDTAQGADWPNEEDRRTRFAVMLDILAADPAERVDLLDFGCGTGELLRHARERVKPRVGYRGIDLSELALGHARRKFPGADFTRLDILQAGVRELAGLAADYCVINGLFTVKGELPDAAMWEFMTAVLGRLWPVTRKAIAFNVMSKQVDWERADLFHVSLDRMAEFLHRLAGRHVTFRADYGLFEYTCYVRKEARSGTAVAPGPPRQSDASMVFRPLLPDANQLAPYLEGIDRRRRYSNFGETALALRTRLAAHFGLREEHCVPASSGTDALTAALIAVAGRATAQRPYCLMPSYTFVATPGAALNAGYQPYFLDIDPHSWALDPERLFEHPVLRQAGAIIVVAPYGQPIAQAGWQRLAASTGVPVVIDAAAGFDAIAADPAATLGELPVMLSLHATKVFGVGEGGLVLCRNVELVQRCGQVMNFGFLGSREAQVAGFNGKLSEYHAAIGLAALDLWPGNRAGFLATAAAYRRAAQRRGLADAIIAETERASNYVLYRAPTAAAAAAAVERLAAAGVDFRLWYGLGCHRQPAYAGCTRDPLPVSEEVAPCVIGLPVAVDLSAAAIEQTVETLART